MNGYSRFPKLSPLRWFSEFINRQSQGCGSVLSASTSGLEHLEAGKLTQKFICASHSLDRWGRLDGHLRCQMATLYRSIRQQWRVLLTPSNEPIALADDPTICGWIEYTYLRQDQTAILIQELAQEVLTSFFSVFSSDYALTESAPITNLPQLGHLDLRALAQSCQNAWQQTINPPLRLHGLASISPSEATFPRNLTSASMDDTNRQFLETDHASQLPTPEPHSRVYTIVCIDDNPSIVRVIQNFLNDEKFSVLAIDNPVKALMQIVRSKPDLILLDVEMPKLDGYELCSLLRRHPSCKNIPIVMVTGNTGFLDRAKAKLVRASDYLTKPFTQSQLLDMVNKHLP